jgi:hypothetical protein
MNKIRRHLNPSQWTEIGTRPENKDKIAKAAQEREKRTQFGQDRAILPAQADTIKGQTDAVVAKTVGVGEATVRRMEAVPMGGDWDPSRKQGQDCGGRTTAPGGSG